MFEHLMEHINLIINRKQTMAISYRLNVSTLKEFEKFSLIFSNCNPFPSVPSGAADNRK